jgi:hypothetical protein
LIGNPSASLGEVWATGVTTFILLEGLRCKRSFDFALDLTDEALESVLLGPQDIGFAMRVWRWHIGPALELVTLLMKILRRRLAGVSRGVVVHDLVGIHRRRTGRVSIHHGLN